MALTEKPIKITKHQEFKVQPAGLSDFERWAYSQAEHGTVIAAAEIANRSTMSVDDLYQSHDGDMLLLATGRIIQNLVGHLLVWGVEVRPECDEMGACLKKIEANRGYA